MSGGGNKLKILVFGRVGGDGDGDSAEAGEAFLKKLRSLNSSRAGPFDAAFCVGSAGGGAVRKMTMKAAAGEQASSSTTAPPIPVYLHGIEDGGNGEAVAAAAETKAKAKAEEKHADAKGGDEKEGDDEKSEADEDGEGVVKLGENLFWLRSSKRKEEANGGVDDDKACCGIWSLKVDDSASKKPDLVVAVCPRGYRTDDGDPLVSKLSHVSYVGCDLLLSHEPPQGTSTILPQQRQRPPGAANSNAPAIPLESWDVAHAALQARARYHFFPNPTYGQGGPFEHLDAATSTADRIRHVGRVVALAPFFVLGEGNAAATSSLSSKEDKKLLKSVHALSLTPLHAMSAAELAQQRPSVPGQLQPCPFTDASYPVEAGGGGGADAADAAAGAHGGSNSTGVAGLSQASARRILREEQERAKDQQHRWAIKKKRQRPGGPAGGGSSSSAVDDAEATNPDSAAHATSTTLFVYGVHQSPELQSIQGKVLLLQALPGATRVRQPPQKDKFAFVEFGSHEQAAKCLRDTGGELRVGGADLTVKWGSEGTGRSKRHRGDDGSVASGKPTRLTEEQAQDSSTIYFKWVVRSEESKDSDRGVKKDDAPSENDEQDAVLAEVLRRWAEATLEDALNEGNDEGDDRVTAADEAALRVRLRLRKGFGFLEFASHAAASMAIATLTGSTDGGAVLSDAKGRPTELWEQVYLNWARQHEDPGKQQQQRENNDVIEDAASGFSFARPHFAPDSRTDCWFCLASSTCEKHLLTGIYEQCYSAMPKGPVHPGHVLLLPISHSSQGSYSDPSVESEMLELLESLRRHADTTYDCDLFVFERALDTKGGLHSHLQCIPVKRQLGLKLQSTMLRQATRAGFELREISSDVALSSILKNQNDDDDETVGGEKGYFYAEVPISGLKYRRFLYKASSKSRGRVPLQFGREVLAAVLEKPELAHWKSCVVDKEQEATIAAAFRESFAKIQSA